MSEEQPKKEKRERKEKEARSKDGVEKKVKKDRKEKKSKSKGKDKEQKLAKTAFSLLADEKTLNPALSSLFNAQVGREASSSIQDH